MNDSAFDVIEKTLALYPHLLDVRVLKGELMARNADVEAAMEEWRTVLRDAPHIEAHNDLGIILRYQGNLDEALFHWREALKIDSRNATAHYYLGDASYEKGEVQEAVWHRRQAIRWGDGSSVLSKDILPKRSRGERTRVEQLFR